MSSFRPMNIFSPISKFGLVVLLFLFAIKLHAQCVNVFPHVDDFEIAPTWTAVTVPGSVGASDWSWGTPNHTYAIQSAGSGVKCWSVGGLTGAFYNYWEQSYVVSPCYDFTNLLYPHVKFKLFYDSEYKFDGGNLQYSLNGGTTWNDVGTVGGTTTTPIPEPTDCNTQNWYNYPGINYLNNPTGFVTSKHGWCGNTQAGGVGWDPANPGVNCVGGNGPGHWLTAEHCLTGLAGQPNVLLRFTFGAGFTCNDFDGFAFDSVAVSNGISNAATVNYTCGNPNSLNFTATPNACPTNTYSWNFGDPTSGPSNTAATQNPSHTFSGAGTYTVTLFATGGACNPPDTIKKVVTITTATVTPVNATCSGGSASVTASGGTPPYTYAWSNGQTSSAVSNLSTGNYSVTVSTPNSCPVTSAFTITQPAAMTSSVSTTNSSCTTSTGTSSVAVTGGSPAFSYSWSTLPVQTTATATGLSAGTYSVLITDANGCTATATANVINSNGPIASVNTTSITCNGANNGAATVTASGGTGVLTYNWIPSGGSNATANGLSPGTYTCVVSDANGCIQPETATITQPAILTASVNSTPANCSIGGNATVTASGGTGALTYLWFPSGGINSTATGLSPGTYSVLITDANGCTLNATTGVTSTAGMTVSLLSAVNVSCNGGTNGNAIVNASGGTSPYTYSWSGSGGINATATGLGAGTYSCVITDASGCSQTQLATITEPPPIVLSLSATSVPCGLSNGTASVSASGGTAPYTYLWLTTPVQTSVQASNLSIGNYSIVVTDANGCNLIKTVSVPQNGASPHANFIFSPDTVSWLDPLVNFTNNSSSSSAWSWNFGDGNSSSLQNPFHTYSNIGTYCVTLIVSDSIGTCIDSITKCLVYECGFTFYIPNAFTPNADGRNDLFSGTGSCVKDYTMYVFDRWGNKIFESNDINIGWDGKVQHGSSGKIVQEDVYVWKVYLTEYNGRQHDYIGHVSLIR